MDANRERLALASVFTMSEFGHMHVSASLRKVAPGLSHLARPFSAFLRRDLLAVCRWDQSSFFAVLDINKKFWDKGDVELLGNFFV